MAGMHDPYQFRVIIHSTFPPRSNARDDGRTKPLVTTPPRVRNHIRVTSNCHEEWDAEGDDDEDFEEITFYMQLEVRKSNGGSPVDDGWSFGSDE